MLQQKKPDDYVIATGIAHSVKELVKLAFDHVGLNWEKACRHRSAFHPFLPKSKHLLGDSSHARKS